MKLRGLGAIGSDCPADGIDGGSLDFDDTAYGNIERSLDFDRTKDGIDHSSLESRLDCIEITLFHQLLVLNIHRRTQQEISTAFNTYQTRL
jgi:hypothetical protein